MTSAAATAAARPSWEFNGVVRLTRIGTTYIFSTIVLAIAAVNTGNNALYISVSLMLGCLLLSGIASKSGLKHLEVDIFGIDEAIAGRPADGMLRVHNRSRIWNVRDIVLTSEAFAAPVLIPLLPSRAEISVPASFLFPRRGVAHVTAVQSYTRYPFGFFLKKRRLRVSSEVVVFPRILDDEVVEERFRVTSGELSTSMRRGVGSEIHSFREYAAGDSLRQVHWKKSASLGRWIMKQHEAEASHSVHVLVDPYKPRDASDDDFEQMISEAATFIHQAGRRGLDVTLSISRVTLRARESQPLAPLFRALALLEPSFEPIHHLFETDTVLFSIAESARLRERTAVEGSTA